MPSAPTPPAETRPRHPIWIVEQKVVSLHKHEARRGIYDPSTGARNLDRSKIGTATPRPSSAASRSGMAARPTTSKVYGTPVRDLWPRALRTMSSKWKPSIGSTSLGTRPASTTCGAPTNVLLPEPGGRRSATSRRAGPRAPTRWSARLPRSRVRLTAGGCARPGVRPPERPSAEPWCTSARAWRGRSRRPRGCARFRGCPRGAGPLRDSRSSRR